MSLEYQRYGRNKDTLVNSTYINSGEYRNKFDKITNNKVVNRVLYSKAKEMLEHRSGTLIEDMYWIDGNTGKVIAKIVDETMEKGIQYTDFILKTIHKEQNLITLHTHPNSMPPSASDFNSAVKNGYKQGLVICHDGKVFSYTANEEIDERLYAFYIDEYIDAGDMEYTAQIKTLNKLEKICNIEFEEVT
jgi:ribonuclease HI